MPIGDDIFLSEPNTDFSHVAGILVTDANQGWYFVGAGAALSSGGTTVPLSKPVLAGDAVTVELVNVTNPPAGNINDFAVSTTTDNLNAVAATYAIGREQRCRRRRYGQPNNAGGFGDLYRFQSLGQHGACGGHEHDNAERSKRDRVP